MTCIIGLVRDGNVWIGADSAVTHDWIIHNHANPKLFRLHDLLIGASGPVRNRQIIQFHLTKFLPAFEEGDDPDDYIFRAVPDAFRACLKEHGSLGLVGTSEEFPFGYIGRVVIMEQMVIDETIQKFLRGDEKEVNAEAIEAAAKARGMVTLLQDGILKACAGETTLEEVYRVI